MLYNCFLKNGIVYVPTVVKMQTGVYSDVEPVAVVPVADTEGLRRGFHDAIVRENAVVPNPPKDNWPPPVLLKYAGVKNWGAFKRDATMWSIKERNGNYQIVGHRTHPDGYWVEDGDQKIEFPAGSKVDQVIERMIAVLQSAAL